jgi:hypothetical protein
MSAIRAKTPQLFLNRKVNANNKNFILLSRSVEVTMVFDSQPQKGLLIFSDQNPLGKSNDARKVFRGEAQAKDIQWLYFKNESGAPTWLGKISTNAQTSTQTINVLLDVEYDKKKSTVSLVLSKKAKAEMPI